MKKNKSAFFILAICLGLMGLLSIQVFWMLEMAELKEKMFNEKAGLVLSKVSEYMKANLDLCSINWEKDKREKLKLEMLTSSYLREYELNTDFSFEVKEELPGQDFSKIRLKGLSSGILNLVSNKPACYSECMEAPGSQAANQKGKMLQLSLTIPKKGQFIRAEIGPLFFSSLLLCFLILGISAKAVFSLQKEKEIAENTTAYLNNMTHEWNTPLSNMALAGKMLAKGNALENPEKVRHLSNIILEENEKLKAQVELVLGLSAMEKGEFVFEKTRTDVHVLLSKVFDSMKIRWEERDGNCQMQFGANDGFVLGNQMFLSQVFINLLENAIKYSPQNPTLNISSRNQGLFILISITDKGLGIEKKYRKKIFEPFFRIPTGDVHAAKGFGLGLAYASKLVALHGGKIEVESEPGKGSTFTIILPNV